MNMGMAASANSPASGRNARKDCGSSQTPGFPLCPMKSGVRDTSTDALSYGSSWAGHVIEKPARCAMCGK